MRRIGVAAGAVLLAAAALGQKPAEIRVGSGPYRFAPVVGASADSVPVLVVVRDRSGREIRGLPAGRFRLSDDGQPERLTSFRAAPGQGKATAGARVVALLFDDVNMDKAGVLQARSAAMRLVRAALGRDVRMAVFTTSGKEQLGFTQDRAALERAITAVTPQSPVPLYGSDACTMSDYVAYRIAVLHSVDALARQRWLDRVCSPKPTLSGEAGGSEPVEDRDTGREMDDDANVSVAKENWRFARAISQETLAVVRNVVKRAAKLPGKRIVVLASSGFLSETLGKQKEAIVGDALRDGVVIDALDATGRYAGGERAPARAGAKRLPLPEPIFAERKGFPTHEAQLDAMASFAAATGGLFFKDSGDLSLGLQGWGLAPEAGYVLALMPGAMAHDGKLHRIGVRLEPPITGATIEARRGYYDPAPGLNELEVERGLYEAMASRATASAVRAEVATKAEQGGLRVVVHLGVNARREKIALAAGLFGGDGRYVSGERGEVDLALKNSTFKKLRKTGLAPGFTLRAPAGDYRLRVVVLNEGTGRLSAFNREVRVK